MKRHGDVCHSNRNIILVKPRASVPFCSSNAVLTAPHVQEAELIDVLVEYLQRKRNEIADDNAAWQRSVGL